MKQGNLKQHGNSFFAYKETTKKKVIAVCVKTYNADTLENTEYFSYKSKFESPVDLREDFPMSLGSNQSIEEIDQFD